MAGLLVLARRAAVVVGLLSLVGCNEAQLDGGSGGGAGVTGGFGGGGTVTPLPCAVGKVIADNCQGCHATVPLFGAPMPLMTWEDVTRPIVWPNSDRPAGMQANAVVGLEMHRRVNNTPATPMPPATVVNQLDVQERDILNAWLGNPVPGQIGQDCSIVPVGGSGGTGGVGAIGGTGGTGGMAGEGGVGAIGGTGGSAGTGSAGTGSAGTGGDLEEPYVGVPPDCDETYEFLAHGSSGANDTTPYNVSAATSNGNKYECFHFSAPWGSTPVQGVYFEPVTDDARVIHHWILYGNTAANGADGSIGNCGSKGYFVQGWAPGGEPTDLPRNVGMQLPSGPNANFTLEVHYNNSGRYTDATDRSGVKVCVTRTPRQHEAAVHWLGTPLIALQAGRETTVSGNCTPAGNATILSVSPHMHQYGTHMRTVINRSGGGTEMLHDGVFRFENQVDYPKRPAVVINPGDTLTTSCTYNNTSNSLVTFGENTEDEMCFNFVLAYPVGSLASSSGNRCLPGGFGF